MKILSLKVKGLDRFALNPDLEEFVYTPSERMNVVIGSNGSGKSTLLRLLLPWPISHRELSEGGYIKWNIEYNHHEYILLVSQTKPHYSIKKDGEELNTSHIVTQQQKLVTSELGIDKNLFRLLTDQISFTTMGVETRKEWFTRLSDTDYSFILGVYNDVKRESYENNTLLKHHETKLATIKEEVERFDIEKVDKQIHVLDTSLNVLLKEKSVIKYDSDELSNRINKDIDQYRPLRTKLLQKHTEYRKSMVGIDLNKVTMDRLNDFISRLKERQATLLDSLEQTSKTAKSKDTSMVPTLDILKNDKERITQELVVLDDLVSTKFKNPSESLISIQTLYSTISPLLHQLQSYEGTSREVVLHKNRNHLRISVEKYDSLSKQILDLNATKEMYDRLLDRDKVECPKCGHGWLMNYDLSKHTSIKDKIHVLSAKAEKLASVIEELRITVSDTEHEIEIAKNIQHCMDECDEISDSIPLRDRAAMLNHNIGTISSRITADIASISNQIASEKLKSELERVEYGFMVHKAANDHTGRSYRDIMDALSVELGDVRARMKRYNTLKTRLENIETLKEEVMQQGNHLNQHVKNILDRLREGKEDVKQQAINTSISSHRVSISKLEQDKTKHSLEKKSYEDWIEEVKLLVSRQAAYKVLTKLISPKGSLVANSIYGFLDTFIKNMNKYMENIWTYRLEIMLPDLDDRGSDLSYRFPLKVNTKERSDVSKGSMAIKNMVDLSFKLVVMDAMGLSGHPVYLDELADGYDKEHRNNLIKYVIETLVHSKEGQFFVVSQDSAVYSQFLDYNTSYTVLSSDNVDLSLIGDFNHDLTTIP